MAKPKKDAPKKKSRLAAAAAATPKQPREKRGLKAYFKGVRTEMKKVVWPTKAELGSYTAVVLIACIFFALAFWAIDTGFLAILKSILGISL